jgi:hypothetical protein
MHQTYVGFLSDIKNAILAGNSQKITYRNRLSDTSGNAKESYVFDVRKLHLVKDQ